MGLAVFNRNRLGALAGIANVDAAVPAGTVLHDEMDAHPSTAPWATETNQPNAEDRFYFRHGCTRTGLWCSV
jgi:hypothetical protein